MEHCFASCSDTVPANCPCMEATKDKKRLTSHLAEMIVQLWDVLRSQSEHRWTVSALNWNMMKNIWKAGSGHANTLPICEANGPMYWVSSVPVPLRTGSLSFIFTVNWMSYHIFIYIFHFQSHIVTISPSQLAPWQLKRSPLADPMGTGRQVSVQQVVELEVGQTGLAIWLGTKKKYDRLDLCKRSDKDIKIIENC